MAKASEADYYLTYLAEKGLRERYHGKPPKVAIDRLQHELQVIYKSGFSSYFLIIADLCEFCRKQDIPIGPGRGSVCGSIMAWAVRITDVNPLLFDIPFERFMHLERIAMPDIDLDVCQRRRQEVIGYLREKYGHDRVTQIVTFGNLTAKTAVNDMCRVLHVDRFVYGSDMTNRYGLELSSLIPEGSGADQVFLQPFMEANDEFAAKIKAPKIKFFGRDIDLVEHVLTIEGQPRHISKHAAGVIISPTPLLDVMPLRSKNGEDETSQYDMHDLEDLGFLKMDCLGLRTVTMLHDIEQMADINFREVPTDDQATFELLARGDTIGVFQLEGAGITAATTGLKPKTFSDVYALIALYRPGPMEQLGSFIARANGEESVSYAHPDLEPILKDTYGLIVFQEQTMKIAQKFAGYTPGEADLFRKAIGKKIPKLIAEQLDEFTKRALKKKYDKGLIEAIANQIRDFGRYGFNIGHSVGYGFITYWTAYAKANFPKEFYCALLNSYIGDIERISTIIRDADRHGIRIISPRINSARDVFVAHPVADSIVFPVTAIKGLGDKSAAAILTERDKSGPFADFSDFCRRLPSLPINVKGALIDAGAFVGPLKERIALLQDAARLNVEARGERKAADPLVEGELEDWQMAERERAVTGFYLTAHPLKLRMPSLALYDLSEEVESAGTLAGIVVKIKKIVSKRGDMAFVSVETLADKCPDLTIFSDLWLDAKQFCQSGAFVIFKYRRQNYNGRTSLVVDAIFPVATDVFPASYAIIRLPHVDQATARAIRQLAKEYEGDTTLKIEIPWWEGRRALLRTEFKIRCTEAFVEEAKQFGRLVIGI